MSTSSDSVASLAPVAIVGGSGFYDLDEITDARRLMVRTPYGEPSSPLLLGQLNQVPVIFLARHGQGHTIPPHEVNYRANLFALAEQGVKCCLAVAAVGAVNANIRDGDLVICDQILDYTSGRAATYVESGAPVTHVDFTKPYSDNARKALLDAARTMAIDVHQHGTYAATQGPRFETKAEIDRFERDGADVVGMTGMPEAVLARELGLAYANVALSVNPAAGRGPDASAGIDLNQIKQTLDSGMIVVRQLLSAALPSASQLSG